MRRNGPERNPARPALPPARGRVASVLAELGDGVTLAELADRLGGHPNATRAHLEALAAGGLAVCAPLPRAGRGRPSLGWSLTEEGRRALAGDPTAAAYAELVSAMASHLAATPGAEGVARAIGRTWGAERAASPSRRDLVAVLDDLGFSPEEGEGVLRLRSCPILDAAVRHPEVVCAIHAGLVEGAGGCDGVRLVPFAEPGACLVEWT